MKSKERSKLRVLFLCALAAGMLTACGVSEEAPRDSAGAPLGTATAAGMDTCANCHLGMVQDWLLTPHANMDKSYPYDLSYAGNPDDPAAIGCAKDCHNPDLDDTVSTFYDRDNLIAGVTGDGATPRPVVGCEACHGNGSNHNGAGQLGQPYRKAGATYAAALTTATSPTTISVTAPALFICATCDFVADGFVAGRLITTSGFTNSVNNATFEIANVTATTITITTTTPSYSPVLKTEAAGTGDEVIRSPAITGSSMFETCTTCHELLAAGGIAQASAAHGAGAVAPVSTDNHITDTHFATSGDWTGIGSSSVKSITGYAMNYTDDRVCAKCHNPHKSIARNKEWARSAHADTNPDNLNATQTGYFSGAWTHYNWSSRPTCQRCKSTTAFTAYADALRTGNTAAAAAINAGTTPPISSNAAWRPEMLTCTGCHTDNKGSLRNPGAISVNYDYVSGGVTYAKASHDYPDLAGSNICMACHTGRESGDTVKGLNDPELLAAGTIGTFNFSNSGFINSHYLTAGGQVFTVTGYEFDGRLYNNIPEYRHDVIGTPASKSLSPYVDTGSNGPCIGCHMSRPNGNGDHIFLPVSRSSTVYGEVTGIASEMCMNCHGPSNTLILDLVKEQKAQFLGSIEVLKEQLANRGIYFFPYNPYFFVQNAFNTTYDEQTTASHCSENLPVKNWQTGGSSTFTWNAVTKRCDSTVNAAGTAGTGKNNMGAAYNFNLLEHDPGAYAHNRMYTKRLIYDSIDWIDDNIMNYSVGSTLNALPAGLMKTESMAYLLPNGIQTGIEAERP